MKILSVTALSAMAISGALLIGCSTDVGQPTDPVGEVTQSSTVHNGTMFNGTMFNGTMFNGTMFNGTMFNGAMFNGTMFNGTMFNGTMFNGTALSGSELTGNLSDGTTVTGPGMIGATLPLTDPDGNVVAMLKIVDVAQACEGTNISDGSNTPSKMGGPPLSKMGDPEPALDPKGTLEEPVLAAPMEKEDSWATFSADTKPAPIDLDPNIDTVKCARPYWVYKTQFAYVNGNTAPAESEYSNYCPNDGWGVFVKGAWNYLNPGGKDPNTDDQFFTLACRGFALAKCVELLGYHPWDVDEFETESLASAYHQACVRMIRLDICGDGTSYTQDGTLINVWDNWPLNTPAPGTWVPEAEWVPEGAWCANVSRLANRGIIPPCLQNQDENVEARCADWDHRDENLTSHEYGIREGLIASQFPETK